MKKRFWFINFLCACSLVGLGWKLRKDWRQSAVHNGPESLEIRPVSGVPAPARLAPADYSVIGPQNPFHAERNDVIAEPTLAKVTGPPPLVYGSVILGDTRFALLASEQSPKPRRVAEGSVFEGYRLVRVLPQSVVLESGAGRNEVMLYNALERLHRQVSKTSANARPAAVTPAATITSAPASPAEVASTGPANSAPYSSNPAMPTVAAPQEKEVMETPFGPILVDKKKR
jgi:hypothetical protein